jgi:hypothetical protein
MAKRLHQAMPHSVLGEQQNELLADLRMLSAACPFDQTNPKDCPLSALRRMKPVKRVQWLQALTQDDLSYLAAYHRTCLFVRVNSALARSHLHPA